MLSPRCGIVGDGIPIYVSRTALVPRMKCLRFSSQELFRKDDRNGKKTDHNSGINSFSKGRNLQGEQGEDVVA